LVSELQVKFHSQARVGETDDIFFRWDSSRGVGWLECRFDIRVCDKCSKGLWNRHGGLVYFVPGQPVPCPLLCFEAFAEYVCIWLEYVRDSVCDCSGSRY
jgi:hypothetical protein